MNIPFSLALDATNIYGVLWNPWGATVPTSVNNSVLANLSADLQERYSLLSPTREVWVTGLTVMGDTVDAKVALGIYDTDRAAFDLLYPIVATVVAGGGMVDQTLAAGSGLFLPLSATRIPVFKFTPVAGSVTITGNVALHVLQSADGNTSLFAPSVFLQANPDGANLLEEATGLPLRTE